MRQGCYLIAFSLLSGAAQAQDTNCSFMGNMASCHTSPQGGVDTSFYTRPGPQPDTMGPLLQQMMVGRQQMELQRQQALAAQQQADQAAAQANLEQSEAVQVARQQQAELDSARDRAATESCTAAFGHDLLKLKVEAAQKLNTQCKADYKLSHGW
jgi:hypothetical protein